MTVQTGITLRMLMPDDWQVYRDLKLEALQKEPWAFSASYDNQKKLKDQVWQRSCYQADMIQRFALYDNEQPVGITAVKFDPMNPRGDDTVLLFGSYIRKDYRRHDYSDYFYRARLGWALETGYSQAEVNFRQNNLVSQGAGKKWGFIYDRSSTGLEFNGEPDDLLHYRLTLAEVAPLLAKLNHTKPIPLLINQ